MYCFLSGFIQWAELFCSSYTLLDTSVIFFFNCWVECHLMDISQFGYSFTYWWTLSLSTMIQMKVVCTFLLKSICAHILSFLLGKYLGMEWLSHMVGVCLTFSETGKWLYHFTFPSIMCESSDCSTFCQDLEMVSLKSYPFW